MSYVQQFSERGVGIQEISSFSARVKVCGQSLRKKAQLSVYLLPNEQNMAQISLIVGLKIPTPAIRPSHKTWIWDKVQNEDAHDVIGTHEQLALEAAGNGREMLHLLEAENRYTKLVHNGEPMACIVCVFKQSLNLIHAGWIELGKLQVRSNSILDEKLKPY